MTFSVSPGDIPEDQLTFPVVLPNGQTTYCPVDAAGRIDPRQAYAPWLRTGDAHANRERTRNL